MTYRDTHYLWKLDNERCHIAKIQKDAFEEMNTIYIADGHHIARLHLIC